ncbi:MAG: ATP-dependent zinc metalloprotease FtsH, partial [Bacteroidetes bacterium]|nr:ATP-dependent zinc metalloprotease FtsH [Bacteroidota bacterium]
MAESKDNNPNQNPQPGNRIPKKGRPKISFYWIYGLLAVIFIVFQFYNFSGEVKEVSWNRLEELLVKQDVDKIIVINKEKAEIYIKKEVIEKDTAFKDFRGKGLSGGVRSGPQYLFQIGTIESFEGKLEKLETQIVEKMSTDSVPPQQILEFKKQYPFPPSYDNRRDFFGDILGYIIPILILIVVWIFIMRMMNRGGAGGAGQIFSIGKSKATLFDKNTHVTITFNDVAGLEEAKVEVMEIVDFLKNPDKYIKLGGKIPKGALLVGPPGTGKTLLAKAVAGEAKVPFFSISGSDFVEMFVGVGASRVRDLFKTAKEKAPCIVFIDEIDAIGRARGRNPVTGANDERENTLNQLLTEMDGFATNAGVIILAATNRADILDRALMRAGRFDRIINVELPDLEERKAIFLVHLKPLKYDSALEIGFLARQTPGFSGADIANVCNESALIAARKNKSIIEKQDFLDAIDRVVGGLEKRNKIISAD